LSQPDFGICAPLWTLLMFESFLRNVMGARATDEARAALVN
jgi:hypothetical protein